ncbi:MAG: dihydrofolate reductase family protein [candidate division WOR-3 bacterium]|nr:MAG: dihydrofolate reductase family protein [candidate division WOR-3 bacterium]
MHNSISLDGSLTGFEVNMALHYQIAAEYKPNAHLIGSNTLKKGLESYGDVALREEKGDFEKLNKDSSLPYWVIPDTSGTLMGSLHTLRRFEFCRDVIVLVSDITPKEYLDYLDERAYDYHIVGEEHVDLKKSLRLLSKKHGVKTVLADTGRILGNLLLNQGLVREVSLLVHPVIVGRKSYNMFSEVNGDGNYELIKGEKIDRDYVWLIYRVKR